MRRLLLLGRHKPKPLSFSPLVTCASLGGFFSLFYPFFLFYILQPNTLSPSNAFHQQLCPSLFLHLTAQSLFSTQFTASKLFAQSHPHLVLLSLSYSIHRHNSKNIHSPLCSPRLLSSALFSLPVLKLRLHKLPYSLPAS